MSITQMKEYLDLCLKGQKSIPERQSILEEKLKELKQKQEEIEASIDYIHKKQTFYKNVLSGKTKYFSYLIPKENDDN